MPDPPKPSRRKYLPWAPLTRGRALVQMLIALCIVSVPMTWVLVNYEGQNLNVTYTMSPVDGWCDAPTEGLGVHCFGDFQLPRLLMDDPENVWTKIPNVPQPYTPLGMVPHLVTKWVAATPLGVRGSLFLYLLVMAGALLVPAIALARYSRSGSRGLIPLLLVGVATFPVIVALDRGNSIGFVVPLLLAFAWTLRRGPVWVAPSAIVVASAFRPQYAIMALAFLAVARYRAFAATVAAALAIQLATFAVWPGGFGQTFDRWWTNITRYGFYVSVTGDTGPPNLSASHALSKVAAGLAHAPGPLGDSGQAVVDFIAAHPAVPGYGLVAVAAIVLALFRHRVPYPVILVTALALPALFPAVSFSYYLVFVLVLAVVVMGPVDLPWGEAEAESESTGGLLDDLRGQLATPWSWAVAAAVAFSLFPLPLVSDANGQSFVANWLGSLWTLIVVVGLGWGAARGLQAHRRRAST